MTAPQLPGLFIPSQTEFSFAPALAPTARQIEFAQSLAKRNKLVIPKAMLNDRASLSKWIDQHKPKKIEGRFSEYPSAKQVAFAERLARLKRRQVPSNCFKDKKLMSRWIESIKPN